MTVPHLVPEFPLLQKFLRVTPNVTSNLSQELYVFHKMGLTELVQYACLYLLSLVNFSFKFLMFWLLLH